MDIGARTLKSRLRGASALSYGLVVGLIAVVSLAAVTSTGSSVDALMNRSADAMIGIAPTPVTTPSLDPADTTPDAFSFASSNNAPFDTEMESAITQITGIGGPAGIGISGDGSPEYRICNDSACSSELSSWGSGGGTVENNQYVQVRLTSANFASASLSATLDVGGITSDFTVTTDSTCPLAGGTQIDFSFTGAEQSYQVPCSGTWEFLAVAASGGGATATERAGGGASLTGRTTLTAGETLYVYVGGEGVIYDHANNSSSIYLVGANTGGFNGGGNAAKNGTGTSYSGGGGGGGTDFRQGGNGLNDRIFVAGGGGGGGSQLDGQGGEGGGGSCGADYCGGGFGYGWSSDHGSNGGLSGGAGNSSCHGGGAGGGGRNSGGLPGEATCSANRSTPLQASSALVAMPGCAMSAAPVVQLAAAAAGTAAAAAKLAAAAVPQAVAAPPIGVERASRMSITSRDPTPEMAAPA